MKTQEQIQFETFLFLHLEHVPVEDVVIGEALAVEQVAKQLPQIAAREKLRIKLKLKQ